MAEFAEEGTFFDPPQDEELTRTELRDYIARQRNVLGDFRVAFVSLFNAIEDLALFWR